MEEKERNVRIALLGGARYVPIIFSFLLENKVEIIQFTNLINVIKDALDLDTEENEVVLKQYANLIDTNYEKAVEILNKCNYKTTADSLTIANVLGLENHNEYNVFVDESFLLDTTKEPKERPWDTKKDFYTKVMKHRQTPKKKRKR